MAWKLFDRGDPAPATREEEGLPPGVPDAACLLCGAPPAPPGSAVGSCALCGRPGAPAERCTAGHALCDGCLGGPAADVVERTCAASEERDPVALALRLVRHPRLRLGPDEHDLLVPSVLLAAWSTARGEGTARAARVREARARSTPQAPAERVRDRALGAAAGAGTFAAVAAEVLHGRSDTSRVDRMISRARALIGEGEDALCQRRNALVAVLAAARFAREGLGADLPARGISCERAGKNPSCVGAGCPFNR